MLTDMHPHAHCDLSPMQALVQMLLLPAFACSCMHPPMHACTVYASAPMYPYLHMQSSAPRHNITTYAYAYEHMGVYGLVSCTPTSMHCSHVHTHEPHLTPCKPLQVGTGMHAGRDQGK